MIFIEKDKVVFDLIKEIPEQLISEYSRNWRNMDRDFFVQFSKKWEKLDTKPINISFPREVIEEIIVKNFYGGDIFSIMIDDKNVYGTIEQYEGYWNAIYIKSDKKLLLFTRQAF